MVAAMLFFCGAAEYRDGMPDLRELRNWRRELEHELTTNILRYWLENTFDRRNGGFVGRVSHDNQIDWSAGKGAVLNARILWTFSAAYRQFGDVDYLRAAERAYDYLCLHFLDPDREGAFWTVAPDGVPLETKKQIYAQAFVLYALAEFHAATREGSPLANARSLFSLLEARSRDRRHGGYFEAYSHDWKLLEDLRLSEKDANEKKSMNTHLHLLEAYTGLLDVWPDPEVWERLRDLVRIFLDCIIDLNRRHLRLFFDEEWRVRGRLISYGHDIECSWLLDEAARALGDDALRQDVAEVAVRMADAALQEGVGPDGGLAYELHEDGSLDTERHWWPQAEAMVGFLNAYQLSSDERFLSAASESWKFIRARIVNREHGEWHWSVSDDGRPDLSRDKVGPWKGPYHNSRACLEGMRRIGQILG